MGEGGRRKLSDLVVLIHSHRLAGSGGAACNVLRLRWRRRLALKAGTSHTSWPAIALRSQPGCACPSANFFLQRWKREGRIRQQCVYTTVVTRGTHGWHPAQRRPASLFCPRPTPSPSSAPSRPHRSAPSAALRLSAPRVISTSSSHRSSTVCLPGSAWIDGTTTRHPMGSKTWHAYACCEVMCHACCQLIGAPPCSHLRHSPAALTRHPLYLACHRVGRRGAQLHRLLHSLQQLVLCALGALLHLRLALAVGHLEDGLGQRCSTGEWEALVDAGRESSAERHMEARPVRLLPGCKGADSLPARALQHAPSAGGRWGLQSAACPAASPPPAALGDQVGAGRRGVFKVVGWGRAQRQAPDI